MKTVCLREKSENNAKKWLHAKVFFSRRKKTLKCQTIQHIGIKIYALYWQINHGVSGAYILQPLYALRIVTYVEETFDSVYIILL